MRACKSIASLAFLITAFGLSGGALATDAGSIEKLSGDVTITNAKNESRRASARDTIQSGDRIVTAPKSEVMIKMADNSVVALRPATTFQINSFKYEQKPTDSSFMSIVLGTARLITGLIGKEDRGAYRITANTATIGIRGTDFEVSVVAEDSADVRAGVYDYVHEGRTNIQIASGQNLDVNKDLTAFAPEHLRPGEEPLQLLPQPPLFLQQSGGFDTLMQSLTIMPTAIIHQMPMFR